MAQYFGPYDEQNRLRVNVEKDTSSTGSGSSAVTTGTQSNVAASATAVTILAANAARKGATIFNDSTSVLFLLVGSGTASATVYTVQLGLNDFYELPDWGVGVYSGVIGGIWTSATGSARVTEYV
jgi:hypothetical protein